MAGPAVILLLGFLIIPFFMAFWFSLTNQRLISPNPAEFVGTRNYTQLLTVRTLTLDPVIDPATGDALVEDGEIVYPALRDFTRNADEFPQYEGLQEWFTIQRGDRITYVLAADVTFMKSIINTFYFAIVVAPVQGALGLALALLVNKRTAGVNVFRTIFFMPVVVSLVVVSILWSLIYDPQNGLLNNILGSISFGAIQPVDWLGNTRTAMPAVMIMSIWQGVGFHMVIWLAGLQTIPGVLYEAASIDGAGRWDSFKFVTWPGLRNTAVLVLITITIQAFGLFTQIDVMTRGGPLDSTSTVIFQAVQQGFNRQSISFGSAISVVFFLGVLAVSLMQRWLTREK